MFSKKNAPAQLDTPNTVLGKGLLMEAVRMTGKESVRIDGVYRGQIDIDGNLVLSDTGGITGDIKAKYIVIAGRVNGNITCENVLHLASTAKVIGDVEAKTLIVDEGSQLLGRYQVGEAPAEATRHGDRHTDKSYLDKSLEIVDNKSLKNKQKDVS